MCLALDYANEINNIIERAKIKCEELKKQRSQLDMTEQDILHKIENTDKFDLYSGWQYTKALHELRKNRRKTKDELNTINILFSEINTIDIIKIESVKEKQNHSDYCNRIVDEKDFNPIKTITNIVNNDLQGDNLRVINSCSRIPKVKGSSIRLRYTTDGEKNHIMNILSKKYIEARLNAEGKYVDLIERK